MFGLGCLGAVIAFVLVANGAFLSFEAALLGIYAIAALGQEWLLGRTGQISLGAAAFMSIGAITTARVAAQPWGVFPLPLIISGIVGAAIGVVIGIPALRLKGLYLILSTLAFQYIVSFGAQQYQGINYEGGFPVPIASLGGVSFASGRPFFLLVVVCLALTIITLSGMYRTAPGRAWNAIRHDELAAAVIGVNVFRWKTLAFLGSSAITACAGSLFAYQTGIADGGTFSLGFALIIVVMIFVGGIGSMAGAVLGAAVVGLIPYAITQLSQHAGAFPSVSVWLQNNGFEVADAIYGAALLIVLLFEPKGIVGVLQGVESRVARRWRRGREPRPGPRGGQLTARVDVAGTEP